MKNKKIFRNIIIVISIIVVLINIGLYIKLNNSYDAILNVENSLDRAGGLIGVAIYWGTFIWGIILLAIIWIQYFLILLTIKVFNKFSGIKKWLLSSLLGLIILGLTIVIISIIRLILVILYI